MTSPRYWISRILPDADHGDGYGSARKPQGELFVTPDRSKLPKATALYGPSER